MRHPNNKPVIQVFVVPEEKEGCLADVANTIDGLQRLVGGYIRQLRVTSEGDHQQDGIVLICNEEGDHLDVNRLVAGVPIRGAFFFGRLQDGDFIDLHVEDTEYIKVLLRTAGKMAFA